MRWFLVSIKVDIPYPVQFEYRVGGSSMKVATARALGKMRGEERIKRKRIKRASLIVTEV